MTVEKCGKDGNRLENLQWVRGNYEDPERRAWEEEEFEDGGEEGGASVPKRNGLPGPEELQPEGLGEEG